MAASNHRGTGLTIGSNLGFEVFPKDTETGGMEVELLFLKTMHSMVPEVTLAATEMVFFPF